MAYNNPLRKGISLKAYTWDKIGDSSYDNEDVIIAKGKMFTVWWQKPFKAGRAFFSSRMKKGKRSKTKKPFSHKIHFGRLNKEINSSYKKNNKK